MEDAEAMAVERLTRYVAHLARCRHAAPILAECPRCAIGIVLARCAALEAVVGDVQREMTRALEYRADDTMPSPETIAVLVMGWRDRLTTLGLAPTENGGTT